MHYLKNIHIVLVDDLDLFITKWEVQTKREDKLFVKNRDRYHMPKRTLYRFQGSGSVDMKVVPDMGASISKYKFV